ncbi:MAG: mandelate racemase [Planctomycetota bacterium]
MLLRPDQLRLQVRPCRTRLPFRFGIATMTEAPMLVAELRADGEGGAIHGYAAELLVPKWFSKDPSTSLEEDRRALVTAVRDAFEAVRAHAASEGGATAFDLWLHAQHACVERPDAPAEERLVRTFGVALVERALIDAVCRSAGVSFFRALQDDLLGIRMERADARLGGWSAADLGKRAVGTRVRHTVGLVDALVPEEVPDDQREGDDHPLSLVDDVRAYGLDCFKVKVSGNAVADLDRLQRIAELTPAGSQVTLDGNEQYDDPAALADLLDELESQGAASGLLGGLIAIEQPVHRARTFDPATRDGVARLAERAPVIIDEADADLSAYSRARELGYGGVSMKACKGPFRALLSRARIQADGEGLQSAEDLTNLPALPLHQDLALVSALGLPNVERNGHHYFRGQDHLAPSEREHLLRYHPDLYAADGRLIIEGGRLSLASLDVPGFGYAGPVEASTGTPAEEAFA